MGLASKALNSATALDRATWATWATCSKHVFVAFVASHLIAKVQRLEAPEGGWLWIACKVKKASFLAWSHCGPLTGRVTPAWPKHQTQRWKDAKDELKPVAWLLSFLGVLGFVRLASLSTPGCPGLWRPHARSNLFKQIFNELICVDMFELIEYHMLNSFEHHIEHSRYRIPGHVCENSRNFNLSRGGVWCWHKASDLLSFSAHLLDSTMAMKTMKTHMDCLGLAASRKQRINEKMASIMGCNMM